MDTAGDVWTATVRALGADPGDSGADLDRRYAQAHRRYHTGTHAAAVVHDADRLAGALALPELERQVAVLAACAHDVVYDARPGEDERASADWARTSLHAVAPAIVERVVTLVLATIEHVAPAGDTTAQVLLDADLAILGSEPGLYDGYVTAVRAEYEAVDDASWRVGRAAVLGRLLDRETIFVTAPGQELWEDAARTNLHAELARLG